MLTLPILCFNDVYRVSQRYVPQPGAPVYSSQGDDAHISVSQFGQLLLSERDKWDDRNRNRDARPGPSSAESSRGAQSQRGEQGAKEGLVLFAGDVFNPSVESSVTRGSHMVSRDGQGVALRSGWTS